MAVYKRWPRTILLLMVVLFIIGLIYFLSEVYQFTNGINSDTTKRDSVLKSKGIRLDSMGFVKDQDYNKVKNKLDSIEKLKSENKERIKKELEGASSKRQVK